MKDLLYTIKAFAMKLIVRYRRLKKRQKSIFWLVVALVILLIGASPIREVLLPSNRQANFYFVAPSEVSVDETFDLEVHVNSKNAAINAVAALVEFNPRIFEIVNMTTEASFCSFYTENSFDNTKGQIDISCGTPSPGFTGDSPIALVRMRSKLVGSSQISVNPDQALILANDGKGTDLAASIPSATIVVKQSL